MPAKNYERCKNLIGKSCKAVSTGEGKSFREENCSNEVENLCCYLCDLNDSCGISCDFFEDLERTKEPISSYRGKYLGGHSMYPSEQSTVLSLYPKKLVVEELNLHIPYSAIKEVKNIKGYRADALRVIAFGTAGALWKKGETSLCIVYNDRVQDQTLVFKVDYLDEAQREIYTRVHKAKRKTEAETEKDTRYIICQYCKVRYDANKNLKCPNCNAINSP
jgi:hypothetical protein